MPFLLYCSLSPAPSVTLSPRPLSPSARAFCHPEPAGEGSIVEAIVSLARHPSLRLSNDRGPPQDDGWLSSGVTCTGYVGTVLADCAIIGPPSAQRVGSQRY